MLAGSVLVWSAAATAAILGIDAIAFRLRAKNRQDYIHMIALPD